MTGRARPDRGLAPPAPPRARAESVAPMINVSFLLLIFFLMTATLAPPAPLAIEPPEASADAAPGAATTLWLGPDGAAAFDGERGPAAIAAAAAAAKAADGALRVAADRRLPARDLARIARRLAEAGATRITLRTRAP